MKYVNFDDGGLDLFYLKIRISPSNSSWLIKLMVRALMEIQLEHKE